MGKGVIVSDSRKALFGSGKALPVVIFNHFFGKTGVKNNLFRGFSSISPAIMNKYLKQIRFSKTYA
jgi:hypothetical protein